MKSGLFVLLPVVAALGLAGCGSSSKDRTDPVVTEKPNPVTPPALKSIELKTVFNGCAGEEPKPNVNIVFHDAEGAVVAEATSNEDGIFKESIPTNAKHISIVDLDVKDRLVYGSKVVTHMDIEDGLNLGTISVSAPQAYQNCTAPTVSSCRTLRVDYTEIESTYPNYSVITQRGHILGLPISDHLVAGPGLSEIENCTGDDVFRFALVSPDGSIAKAAQVEPSHYITPLTIELVAEDFIYDGVPVDNEEDDFAGNASIVSYKKTQESDQPYDVTFSVSTTAMQFIFPDLADAHQYRARWDEEVTVGEYTVDRYYASRSSITETGQLEFEPPTHYTKGIEAGFLSGNMNNSFSFDYDFSNLDDRFHAVSWYLNPTDSAGESVNWNVVSDTSGTIPAFQFGELLDINSAEFSAMQSFEIAIFGHPHAPQGFKDYREFRQSSRFVDFDREEYKSFVQAVYFFEKYQNQ
ncbi:hypothetical protein L1077_00130 [Pseudoalteromonas luteoviolacea]|uniref:hypothetical protein n=1 Tax=Pseudoalteromonas luteoviolacea TaxID=43657 RepID=UPI001F280759|nr:hypothetical protein [Pseudoalteromonas luteoviolacea]MCF6437847.1 hypothetical protein [Pseudoalteromonas luteoviolacea]